MPKETLYSRKDLEVCDLSWIENQKIAIPCKNGRISIYNLEGVLSRNFSLGAEAEERGIIAARFFNIDMKYGVAVMTSGFHIYYTSSIDKPTIKRLSSSPLTNSLPSDWCIRVSLDENSLLNVEAIVANDEKLFICKSQAVSSVDFPQETKVVFIAISVQMKLLAHYRENGQLIISDIQFTKIKKDIQIEDRPIDTPPNDMRWAGTSGIVLSWPNLLLFVDLDDESTYEFFFPEDFYIEQDFDGVRIISQDSHEFLQHVPYELEKIGKIGASGPAVSLLNSYEITQARDSNNELINYNLTFFSEYFSIFKSPNQLQEAILSCLKASMHTGIQDPEWQVYLLNVAKVGLGSLQAMIYLDKTSQTFSSVKNYEHLQLSQLYTVTIFLLKFLSTLRQDWIGLKMTWKQFHKLGPDDLMTCLLNLGHYPVAVQYVAMMNRLRAIEKILTEENSITLDSFQGMEQIHNGFTTILNHWATKKIPKNSPSDKIQGKLIKIFHYMIDASHGTYSNLDMSQEKPMSFTSQNDHLRLASLTGLAISDIAGTAFDSGNEELASILISFEVNTSRAVPILLKLKKYSQACARALDSGNPDLLSIVFSEMEDKCDVSLVLSKYPQALALYQMQMDEKKRGISNIAYSNVAIKWTDAYNRLKVAGVMADFNEKVKLINKTEEAYKQLKDDFMQQETLVFERLITFQKNSLEDKSIQAPIYCFKTINSLDSGISRLLPSIENEGKMSGKWIGESAYMTLIRLVSVRQEKLAAQLKKEVMKTSPEKVITYANLIGLSMDCKRTGSTEVWFEINRLVNLKKSPVTHENLATLCYELNRADEAERIIQKVSKDRQIRLYTMIGRFNIAIELAAELRSYNDLVHIQKRLASSGNATMQEKIRNYLNNMR